MPTDQPFEMPDFVIERVMRKRGRLRVFDRFSDANAARHEDDHQAGFTTLYQSFGDVLTAHELLDDVLINGRAAVESMETYI